VTTKEFISLYLKKHSETGNKKFPVDFTALNSIKTIALPYNFPVIGNELFGKIEILTKEGYTVYLAENIYEAKYIVYYKRYSGDDIIIPADNSEVKTAVISYEKYLDGILADIKEQLKHYSMDALNLHSVSNEIFMKLNLVRY
jgi:hypothetical protein